MIPILEENLILIITEEKKVDYIKKYNNVDIENIQINSESINKINMDSKEKYSYIFFKEGCNYVDELVNFLPVFSINKVFNKLFINELLVNPIIMENIQKIVDSDNEIELAIIIKHILRNNIKKEDFTFIKELKYMQDMYKCTDNYINSFKDKIYKTIEQHYSQDSIIRKIKYRMNKDEIVKTALYKLVDVINNKLKNTNELVFKEFISTTI